MLFHSVIRNATIAGALGVAVTLAPDSSQAAEQVASFYSGKQVSVVIGAGTSGGYNRYSRTIARHMENHLPGNPSFIPKNMPGAGSVIAANYCFNIAERDGSVICALGRGMFTAPMLYGNQSKAQYEAEQFQWIGSANQEFGMGVMSASAPASTVKGLKTTEVVLGSTGPETDPSMYARLFNQLLGTKFNVINGYKQQSEIILAMDRGEVDGLFISGWSGPNVRKLIPEVEAGKVVPFVQLSLKRNKAYPDVPSVMEFIEKDADKAVMELIFARLALGRPMVAPPGVPKSRIQALRVAYEATFSDPAFLADAEKQGLRLAPIFGDEAEELMTRIYNTPDEVVNRTKSLVTPGM